jgi:hypothetical protein
VKLAFTRDAEALTAALMRDFPRRDLVDPVPVTFSLAQLQSVADRISADSRDLEARGIKLTTWSPDVKGNRVEVGIEDLTPADAELLKARYGAVMLTVVEQRRPRTTDFGCLSRFACTPVMRGGLDLYDAAHECTSGFEATKSGRSVLLTAGHCFSLQAVFHSEIQIGFVEQNGFVDNGDNDAEVISQADTTTPFAPWKPSNWLYVSGASQFSPDYNVTYSITAVKPKFGEVNGEYICATGITNNLQCDEVRAVNIPININDNGTIIHLTGQNKTGLCGLPGDSGGPLFNVGIGYGMHSASNFFNTEGGPACYGQGTAERYTTYSPLAEAEADFGVVVRRATP